LLISRNIPTNFSLSQTSAFSIWLHLILVCGPCSCVVLCLLPASRERPFPATIEHISTKHVYEAPAWMATQRIWSEGFPEGDNSDGEQTLVSNTCTTSTILIYVQVAELKLVGKSGESTWQLFDNSMCCEEPAHGRDSPPLTCAHAHLHFKQTNIMWEEKVMVQAVKIRWTFVSMRLPSLENMPQLVCSYICVRASDAVCSSVHSLQKCMLLRCA
jgi:hypothetical protein